MAEEAAGKKSSFCQQLRRGIPGLIFLMDSEGNYLGWESRTDSCDNTNESAVEFEGYFVFRIKTPRNRFTAETVEKAFLSKLFPGSSGRAMEETAFYVPFSNLYSGERNRYKDFFCRASGGEIRLFLCPAPGEQFQRDTGCTVGKKRFLSEGFFQSKVEVCVVEEEI